MSLPPHAEIRDQINKIVQSNLECSFAHNRENLEDVIADLIQYRDTLPTIQEYMDANEL